MDAQIRSFHRIGRHAMAPIPEAKLIDKNSVLRAVDALKVVPGGIIAESFFRGQAQQLNLANAEIDSGNFLRRNSGRAEKAGVKQVRVTDQGIEDHVWLTLCDGTNDPGYLRAVREHVLFADNLPSQPLDLVPNNRVYGPRIYGIPPYQKEPLLSQETICPLNRGDNLLIGRRAGVKDVRTLLHSFVLSRIHQQVVHFLHDREH